jgi:hypothetical protein
MIMVPDGKSVVLEADIITKLDVSRPWRLRGLKLRFES